MIKIEQLKFTARRPSLEAMVPFTTITATVFLYLISALAIGLVIYLALNNTKLSKHRIQIDEQETLGD
jgi:MFS superfamily sulfate permease-like transporter